MSRASELLEKIALAEEQSTADAIRLKKKKAKQMKRVARVTRSRSMRKKARKKTTGDMVKAAHRKAINAVKDKFSIKMGGKPYKDQPPAMQVKIDRIVKNKQPLIKKIEKRAFKQIRAAEQAKAAQAKAQAGGEEGE